MASDAELAYDLAEAKSELRRHHVDFERIQLICHRVEVYDNLRDGSNRSDAERFLLDQFRQIRGIVG